MDIENEGQQLTLTYQEYWAILRRRRNVVLQVFAAVFIVGVIVTIITKPTYEATSELLVDPPQNSIGTIGDNSDPLAQLYTGSNDQTAETQVQALQAQPLLDQVQQTCGRAKLDVEMIKDTNVIQVFSESSSPQVAANAANTLLDDYLQEVSDRDLQDVKNARDFVQLQEVQTGIALDDAESNLRDFRASHNIDQIQENRDALINKVTALETSYETTQAALAGAQAQYQQALGLFRNNPEGETGTANGPNPAVAALQSKISDLEIQRSTDLQGQAGYTPTSTVITQLDSQIAALKRDLAVTPPSVKTLLPSINLSHDAFALQIDGYATQVASLRSQVKQIAAELQNEHALLNKYPDLESKMDTLTRERDDALRDDEAFSQNLDNLNLRLQAEHVGATIIQRADVPITPARPNKLLNVIISLLAGLIIGCSVALIQEYIDDRINSTEDAERLLELPSLGRVPQLSADDARLLPQMKGLDPETESYRILRTNIHFASIDHPLRTMQVTSSGPGEGKTTTAANLAFAMAMDGKKVILVDTDLRRPSLHKLLGLRQTPGVTDLLLGTATLDQAIRPHEALAEMSVIAAGITPPNPSELLNSQKFRNLIDQLKERADIVIFDSPPVLAASDAQIISSIVDGVIIVVANSETRKASARQSLKILRQARANVLGVAYNKTNIQESYYYYHYHYSTPTLAKEEEEENARALLTKAEDDNAVGTK